MKENTPSNGWNGKSRLTHPHDRCMNKISPFLRLINYIAGTPWLYDTLYTMWGSEVGELVREARSSKLAQTTDTTYRGHHLSDPLTFENSVV